MKPAYLLTLCIVCLSFTFGPTAYSAEQETRQLSVWERIFGTTEQPSQEKAGEDSKQTAPKEKKVNPKFSDEEREALESWQKGNAKWKQSKKRLPPGLQKKVDRGGELPPGWKKKLEIGSVLDPELEKEAKSLPEEILKRLPKTPDGTEIIQIGDEVIRIFENSREIIDILNGARERSRE